MTGCKCSAFKGGLSRRKQQKEQKQKRKVTTITPDPEIVPWGADITVSPPPPEPKKPARVHARESESATTTSDATCGEAQGLKYEVTPDVVPGSRSDPPTKETKESVSESGEKTILDPKQALGASLPATSDTRSCRSFVEKKPSIYDGTSSYMPPTHDSPHTCMCKDCQIWLGQTPRPPHNNCRCLECQHYHGYVAIEDPYAQRSILHSDIHIPEEFQSFYHIQHPEFIENLSFISDDYTAKANPPNKTLMENMKSFFTNPFSATCVTCPTNAKLTSCKR